MIEDIIFKTVRKHTYTGVVQLECRLPLVLHLGIQLDPGEFVLIIIKITSFYIALFQL